MKHRIALLGLGLLGFWIGSGCPSTVSPGSEKAQEQGVYLEKSKGEVAGEPLQEQEGAVSADGSVQLPWPDLPSPEPTPPPEPTSSEPVSDGGVGTEPSASEPQAPQCTGKSAPSRRDEVRRLSFGSQNRVYRLHIPPGYKPTHAMPLVLNLHGYGSDSWQQSLLTRMNAHADKHGYIVVYPEGTGLVKAWNAGGCCPPRNARKSDDVGFINALLDQLEKDLCVDKRRIFSTGMSNGGFMTHRLACEASHRIAAFGAVAGHMLADKCAPKRPIPILHFHGTSDTIVPYKGNKSFQFPTVQESIDFWVKHNGCDATPQRIVAKGDVTCDQYQKCNAGVTVTLCTIHNGGHTWPGGLPIPAGKTTKEINATEEIWKFFQKFPLP